MPLIIIKVPANDLTTAFAHKLGEELTHVVATQFSSRLEPLKSKEVEVEIRTNGPDDTPRRAVRIIIILNSSPDRKRGLAKSITNILEAIRENGIPEYFKKGDISVWVQLVAADYGEI